MFEVVLPMKYFVLCSRVKISLIMLISRCIRLVNNQFSFPAIMFKKYHVYNYNSPNLNHIYFKISHMDVAIFLIIYWCYPKKEENKENLRKNGKNDKKMRKD